MDNFDLKKYLVENRVTNQSRLNEGIGIYLSDINLGIIIKSLQKSKLVDPNVIEALKNKEDVSKYIMNNKDAIHKSLKMNGKTLGLNPPSFNMLMDKINDLTSGQATFVDYID
jgi:hypothetical protein